MTEKPKNYLKWFTVGCLGITGILALFVMFIIWRFTPLISVDNKEGKVQILGGMITVDEGNFGFSGEQSNALWLDYETTNVQGDYIPLDGEGNLQIFFDNIKADLKWREQRKIKWACKLRNNKQKSLLEKEGSNLVLYLKTAKECEITIPQNLDLHLRSKNGQLTLHEPLNSYEIELNNGMVQISPAPKIPFHYEFSLRHGSQDAFDQNPMGPNIKKAMVTLRNGSILRK